MEVKGKMPKNGGKAGKDVVTGQMIKNGNDLVMDWVWKLCNITFEHSVVPEN